MLLAEKHGCLRTRALLLWRATRDSLMIGLAQERWKAKCELSQAVEPCGEGRLSPSAFNSRREQVYTCSSPVSRGLVLSLLYKEKDLAYQNNLEAGPMSSSKKNTDVLAPTQEGVWNEQEWQQLLNERLPKAWQEQAITTKARQRTRKLACIGELLPALLVDALYGSSFRQLGIWATLVGLGSPIASERGANGWNEQASGSCG